MMMLICSSVLVDVLFVIWFCITPKHVQFEVIIFCFVNAWTILIVSGWLTRVLTVANDIDTEWDDGCPGLVETLAREVAWEVREAQNDAEAARWAVDPPDGWGNTPPASPICEGWPGALVDKHGGVWPSPSEVVLTRADGWPNLSTSVEGGIEVTIKVVTDVGDSQEKLPISLYLILNFNFNYLSHTLSSLYQNFVSHHYRPRL
jgi:hypothetical protein